MNRGSWRSTTARSLREYQRGVSQINGLFTYMHLKLCSKPHYYALNTRAQGRRILGVSQV